MNKEINKMNWIFKNVIYCIIYQWVYILIMTRVSHVFVTIFAGERQEIAPKTNLPGLQVGAINSPQVETWGYSNSTPTELVHATLFFCIQAGVGVYLPPIYWRVSDHTNIKTLFFGFILCISKYF